MISVVKKLGMCQKGAILSDGLVLVQAQNCQVDLTHALQKRNDVHGWKDTISEKRS